jgi:hypothetical protein
VARTILDLGNLGQQELVDGNRKITWGWLQFFLSLVRPTRYTIPLAKITPAGTDGSISFNSVGIITEYELPT